MKKIVESEQWHLIHLQADINICDYPNRNNGRDCGYTDAHKCEDCEVYKLGLYKRENRDRMT